MGLQSKHFKGNRALEDCLARDASHVTPGAAGEHVAKIQAALFTLDNASITAGEIALSTYGASTARAVKAYRTKRGIVRFGQTTPGDIVGKMTIARLDQEMLAKEKGSTPPRPGPKPPPSKADIIKKAFERSRDSLRIVLHRLDTFKAEIDRVDGQTDPLARSVLILDLKKLHARDIAVLAGRLVVTDDPLAKDFRDALHQARHLIQRNLNEFSNIIDEDITGRCDPNSYNPPLAGPPFAGTDRAAADPRVSVCRPFFASGPDLQRDVITHEFFHLLGLQDKSVNSTADALTNANTLAQIVAWLHDRHRQKNSDGHEGANPPLPAP
jgi:hypothetical protein